MRYVSLFVMLIWELMGLVYLIGNVKFICKTSSTFCFISFFISANNTSEMALITKNDFDSFIKKLSIIQLQSTTHMVFLAQARLQMH